MGLTEAFDGGEEACSAGRAAGGIVLLDLIAGGAVLDTALIQTTERVAAPEMLNRPVMHHPSISILNA